MRKKNKTQTHTRKKQNKTQTQRCQRSGRKFDPIYKSSSRVWKNASSSVFCPKLKKKKICWLAGGRSGFSLSPAVHQRLHRDPRAPSKTPGLWRGTLCLACPGPAQSSLDAKKKKRKRKTETGWRHRLTGFSTWWTGGTETLLSEASFDRMYNLVLILWEVRQLVRNQGKAWLKTNKKNKQFCAGF